MKYAKKKGGLLSYPAKKLLRQRVVHHHRYNILDIHNTLFTINFSCYFANYLLPSQTIILSAKQLSLSGLLHTTKPL